MSATISESPSVVTFINVFDVKPHEQGDLVELIERTAVEVMQYLDGFISASGHRESPMAVASLYKVLRLDPIGHWA